MLISVIIREAGKIASEYRASDDTGQPPADIKSKELEITFDQHFGIRLVHQGKDIWAQLQFREGGTWSPPEDARKLVRAKFAKRTRKPAPATPRSSVATRHRRTKTR